MCTETKKIMAEVGTGQWPKHWNLYDNDDDDCVFPIFKTYFEY